GRADRVHAHPRRLRAARRSCLRNPYRRRYYRARWRISEPAPGGRRAGRQSMAAARISAPRAGQATMNGPEIVWLPDGRRLHMNHGPIDLIVEAFGAPAEVEAAYRQAARRFRTILDELAEELAGLRRPSTSRL